MHWLYNSFKSCVRVAIRSLARFLIIGLRPLLGPATCRFEVGCTKYALEMLDTKQLEEALWLIVKRVISCNPL